MNMDLYSDATLSVEGHLDHHSLRVPTYSTPHLTSLFAVNVCPDS